MTMDTIAIMIAGLMLTMGALAVALVLQGDYARRLAERNATQAVLIMTLEKRMAVFRAQTGAGGPIGGGDVSRARNNEQALYGASTGKMEGVHERADQAGHGGMESDGVARTLERIRDMHRRFNVPLTRADGTFSGRWPSRPNPPKGAQS